jgi:hypothetical protein
MHIDVECTDGHDGEQTPVRLKFDHRTVEVAEIIDRWPGPDHCYVKLKGRDSALYILRCDTVSAQWRLVLFKNDQRLAEIS